MYIAGETDVKSADFHALFKMQGGGHRVKTLHSQNWQISVLCLLLNRFQICPSPDYLSTVFILIIINISFFLF